MSKFEPRAVSLVALVKFYDQIYRLGFCKVKFDLNAGR